MPDDLLEHLADVRGADEDRIGAFEHPPPPRLELQIAPQRVLELRPVHLDGVARARLQRDGASREHVVREHEVGGKPLADRGRVQLDVALALRLGQLLEAARLETLVAVDDEDRQDAADLGPDRLGAAEVVRLRVRLLREDHDLVPGPAPFVH